MLGDWVWAACNVFTLLVDWYHQRAAPVTGSAWSCVLVPTDFGTSCVRSQATYALGDYKTLIGSHNCDSLGIIGRKHTCLYRSTAGTRFSDPRGVLAWFFCISFCFFMLSVFPYSVFYVLSVVLAAWVYWLWVNKEHYCRSSDYLLHSSSWREWMGQKNILLAARDLYAHTFIH